MDDIKLEALSPDEQKQFYDQAVKNAEVNYLNARGTFIAARSALEAIRRERDQAVKNKTGE